MASSTRERRAFSRRSARVRACRVGVGELEGVDAECVGEGDDGVEADAAGTGFVVADVGSWDLGALGELGHGQAGVLAQFTETAGREVLDRRLAAHIGQRSTWRGPVQVLPGGVGRHATSVVDG